MAYEDMTVAELTAAMDAMDAELKQPESGLKVRIFGALSPDTPHYEYFRRSVMNARFLGSA